MIGVTYQVKPKNSCVFFQKESTTFKIVIDFYLSPQEINYAYKWNKLK